MKRDIETVMGALGEKMGVATAAETAYCLVAFAGVALALAFGAFGLNMNPAVGFW